MKIVISARDNRIISTGFFVVPRSLARRKVQNVGNNPECNYNMPNVCRAQCVRTKYVSIRVQTLPKRRTLRNSGINMRGGITS
jgi:hypothetical protein